MSMSETDLDTLEEITPRHDTNRHALIQEVRRSHTEAAELRKELDKERHYTQDELRRRKGLGREVGRLRERVEELEGALRKCLTYLTTTIDVMRRRHPELIPEAGLVEEALEEEVRAALSQAKLESQEESRRRVEKPEVED